MNVTRRAALAAGVGALAMAPGTAARASLATTAVGDESARSMSAEGTLDVNPLPSDLAGLPQIEATLWATVSSENGHSLEGLVFDAAGRLYCCHRFSRERDGEKVTTSEVLMFDDDGASSVCASREGAAFNGIAFGPDGRAFLADMTGHILALDLASGEFAELPSSCDGHQIMPNDVVLGPNDDLYIADFSGNAFAADGGVYRLHAADSYQTIELVQGGLRTCNGIAFTPDRSHLWVAETSMNRVVRIAIDPQTGDAKTGFLDACVVYQGQGTAGPDSMRVDASGNVYQAFMPDGRAVVFNAKGIPIANVLPVDRSEGTAMMSTCPGLSPLEPRGYLAAYGKGGAYMYSFAALDVAADAAKR